jgi:integrase/recombinase XerD
MEAQSHPLGEEIEWFLDHLRVEKGASEHTIQAYHLDLEVAAKFFHSRGVTAWTDIQPTNLLGYETFLGPGIARTTAQRRISALRSLLKFLKKNNVGPTADLPSTGGFRKPKTLPKALRLEQMVSLLGLPDLTKPNGIRDRALMELIYGAGLRVSEAVELEMGNLDLEGRSVQVLGKRGKVRRTPLPQETAVWMKRYLEAGRPNLAKRASARVFISDKGHNLLRQTAYDILEKYALRAGLPDGTSPHTLRHTYAVHLLKGGADLRAVQELLGHASIATTQVYTQLDMEQVRLKYKSAHPRD